MKKYQFIDSFVLKIIALISMTIDHIGFFLFPSIKVLRYIGRIAFPLFGFQTAISMRNTKNKNKYVMNMLFIGLIIELVTYLFNGELYGNIFLSLGVGSLSCLLFDDKRNISQIALIALLTLMLFPPLQIQFGIFGVIMILGFYILYYSKMAQMIFFALIILILTYIERNGLYETDIIYPVYSLISLVFIGMYNGKRGFGGKKTKAIFYLYYPLHIGIIILIQSLKDGDIPWIS